MDPDSQRKYVFFVRIESLLEYMMDFRTEVEKLVSFSAHFEASELVPESDAFPHILPGSEDIGLVIFAALLDDDSGRRELYAP